MNGGVDTTIFAAFGVGMLSFFSPCVLPLVPGYLSAISGVALGELAEGEAASPRRLVIPALIFVASFTAVFMLLGLVATGVGTTLSNNLDLLRKISGVAIVLLGLFMAATLVVPRLNFEMRSQQLAQRAGAGGPIIAGAAFAIAWTPCVGPTLGAILTAAASQQHVAQGALLLFCYSAGLAVPFLLTAMGIGAMAGATAWIKRHYPLLIGISSAVLIVIGVMIFTDEFFRLNNAAGQLTRSLNLSF